MLAYERKGGIRMYKFKIIINSCGEIIKQLFEQMKTGIHTYIEEKNKKALEEQQMKLKSERDQILTIIAKEFVEVLKDMPDEFNIKKSLSTFSLSGKFITNCSISLNIPKADASVTLRPAQCITLRHEIQGRTERLRNEAQSIMDDFYHKYEFEYNMLSEKAYYSGSQQELIDYDIQARIDCEQLRQTLFMRFWKYDVVRVMDSDDSTYITVDFYFSIPE